MKLRKPDYIGIYSEIGNKIFKTSNTATLDDITVNIVAKNEKLLVNLSANTTPVCYIRLRWSFTEQEKRKDNVKILGDEWERGYGEMEWRGISPTRCMHWAFAVSNGSDRKTDYNGRYTECFGVKVRPNAFCFWQYDSNGIILWLDVRCGGCGVILNNRELQLCEITFSDYYNTSAFNAIKEYYKTLCDDPLKVNHKVYGTNNWYYAYGNSSHDDILSDTDLLVERCKDLENPPYMVIDDGWELNNADAPWDILRDGFRNMKQLAKQIRERGARPGIWFRPLCDVGHSIKSLSDECRLMRDIHFLDPSHPDVLEYVRNTVKMLVKDWEYEFIKHDFSTWDVFGFWGFERKENLATDGWHFWNRNKTSAEIIADFYRAIFEATNNKALILGCDVIGHLAAGLVHLNRIGDDTSGKEWERTRNYGINSLAFRMMHHGAFYEADADCAGITEDIDWKLNSEWLKALSVSGTPMFVSPKPDILNNEQASELIQAYARNSVQDDVLIPLDWMENVCPEYWLLNGESIHFNWYPEHGVESFKP